MKIMPTSNLFEIDLHQQQRSSSSSTTSNNSTSSTNNAGTATVNSIGDERALQLALELSMLGLSSITNASETIEHHHTTQQLHHHHHHHHQDGLIGDDQHHHHHHLGPFGGLTPLDEVRAKKSQNMTECVPVPSSEHVAEIVGRQGCKIKALRAKTNTYIKTPVRGEEPVFVVTGRKEDVAKAKREILSAAEHFSQIRASRKNNLAGGGGSVGGASGTATPPGPPANVPGHVTIQVRVPYRVVGLVVGPKGATIKRIQHQTHTYIVTPSRDKEPVFEVTGLPESVDAARREIEAHIAMRTGSAALSGNNGGGGGGTGSGLVNLDENELLASLCKTGLSSILNYMEQQQQPVLDTTNITTATTNNTPPPGTLLGFGTMTSSTSSSGAFSSSGSCSSSSSSIVNGRDLGTIWTSTDSRDEGLGDSPNFDSALSSIWSYPSVTTVTAAAATGSFVTPIMGGIVTRPSPTSSTSPVDSLLSAAANGGTSTTKCLVCHDARVTHALVPCGHNFFCMDCAQSIHECPVCQLSVAQAIRIFSANN